VSDLSLKGRVKGGGSANVTRLGGLEIAGAELKKLSGAALIERLVASGFSRLGAERMVAIDEGRPSRGVRARARTPGDEATGALMGVIFSEMSSV
jgi:hypothetical protein